jgi:hypothetical protein
MAFAHVLRLKLHNSRASIAMTKISRALPTAAPRVLRDFVRALPPCARAPL